MNKFKPVPIRNQRALSLLHKRALQENRSLANAGSTTIIEALSLLYGMGEAAQKQAKSEQTQPNGGCEGENV